MNQNMNLFRLLKDGEIVDVLDGDKVLGNLMVNGENREIRMPYYKGKEICDLSKRFGFPMELQTHFGPSRSSYMTTLLENAINGNIISDLLVYLFSKERFTFGDLPANDAEKLYCATVNAALNKINSILSLGGNELQKGDSQFIVCKSGTPVTVDTPSIKTINHAYIKKISERVLQDIEQNNYDSALTKSRTLLEEVFIYVIEQKGETHDTSGDIGKLYKHVKELYNMHNDHQTDKRILSLLSGLNSIINAIAEMRNKNSDAHGVGATRINIKDYHARLFVNASMTIAEFILSVANNANKE